jgi:hypothetical protein
LRRIHVWARDPPTHYLPSNFSGFVLLGRMDFMNRHFSGIRDLFWKNGFVSEKVICQETTEIFLNRVGFRSSQINDEDK